MYENLMNRFKWGNAEDPDVYLDENNRRMFSNFRRLFGSLAIRLAVLGDTAKAVEVARRGLEIVPENKIPYDYFIVEIAEALIRTGNSDEGMKLIDQISAYADEYLAYAVSLKPGNRFGLEYPIGINMQTLIEIYRMAGRLGLGELEKRIEPDLNKYYSVLYSSTSE
jgi:hypothetical protein